MTTIRTGLLTAALYAALSGAVPPASAQQTGTSAETKHPSDAHGALTTEEDIRARADRSRLDPMTRDDVQEIAAGLADFLESALDGDIDGVVDNLSKADRQRLGDTRTGTDLEQAASLLESSWETKYGDEIDWDDNAIQRQVLDYRIGKVEKKIARVELPPASPGAPAAYLRLVDEGVIATSWRIDTPDTLGADELQSKIRSELQAIERDKASWPADSTQAAKQVASRILSIVAHPE